MKRMGANRLIMILVMLTSVIVVGCGSNWPANWSKDLPEFKYGHVSPMKQNYMDKALGTESVSISDFEPNALAKYKADVTSAGWDLISDENTYFSATKDGHVVSVLIGSMDGVNVGFISYKD